MANEIQQWMREAAAEIEIGKDRCPICGWPLAESSNEGCVIGNCSYRPGDNRGDEKRNLQERGERWLATAGIIAAHAPNIQDVLALHHKWVTVDDLSHEEVQVKLAKALGGDLPQDGGTK